MKETIYETTFTGDEIRKIIKVNNSIIDIKRLSINELLILLTNYEQQLKEKDEEINLLHNTIAELGKMVTNATHKTTKQVCEKIRELGCKEYYSDENFGNHKCFIGWFINKDILYQIEKGEI